MVFLGTYYMYSTFLYPCDNHVNPSALQLWDKNQEECRITAHTKKYTENTKK